MADNQWKDDRPSSYRKSLILQISSGAPLLGNLRHSGGFLNERMSDSSFFHLLLLPLGSHPVAKCAAVWLMVCHNNINVITVIVIHIIVSSFSGAHNCSTTHPLSSPGRTLNPSPSLLFSCDNPKQTLNTDCGAHEYISDSGKEERQSTS